jgi:hypothetical protein
MGKESDAKMKTTTKNFRIITWGAAFSELKITALPQEVRSVPVLKTWSSSTGRTRDTGEFLLVFSNDLDDTFTAAFREYATQDTRLLVFQHHGVSADRLVTRIVDLQIRSPQRFCIINAEWGAGKSHYLAFIHSVLKRLTASHVLDDLQERILDATIEDGILHVVSANLNRLDVPIAKIRACENVAPEKLLEFEIDEDGAFIYWPSLDLHLGWAQFQQLIDPEAALKASQKSEDFNKRYGRAVQKLREAQGLKTSDIPGLSEKQLGRIERGECRLTSNAIDALSKAHEIKPNEYMQKLADALEGNL